MVIDPTTLRNLEVHRGGRRRTVRLAARTRSIATITPMGGRLLRAWLLRPLVALERIQDRLDAVEEFAFRSTERAKVRDTLKSVHDIERLVAPRRARHRRPARSRRRCAQSIAAVPRVRMLLDEFQAPLVRSLAAELDDLADLRDELDRTLLDEPPAMARDGGVVRDGVDPELDDLRGISRSAASSASPRWKRPSARAPASRSLKIRYNRVFGYYIEVSRSNLGSVPADYHRKQTIAGGERFITPGAEGVRGKGARRRRADRRARGRDLRRAARGASRRRRRASRTPRAGWPRSTCSARWPKRRRVQNYTKPLMHAGDELVADRRAPRRSSSAMPPTRSCPTTSRSTARRTS